MCDNIKERVCYICKNKFPLNKDNFYSNKSKKDGFDYRCKNCSKRQTKEAQARVRKENKEQVNRKQRKSREERLSKGLCKFCNNKRLENSNQFCEKHFFENVSNQHTGTTKKWKEFKNLLKSQEYICPYTGDELILGLNASVDHIRPQFSHPELYRDINNMQWVDIKVNVMKRNLSEEEFLDLIRKIYNKKIERCAGI